ncbi:anosmin-1b [Aplochiton taeniatus]
MSFCWVGLLFVGCVLLKGSARRTAPGDGEDFEKINSARCTSRCLTLHMTQLTSAFKHLQNDDVLVWCESHRRCSQCLQPCKELWETQRSLSQKACEKQPECVTSWEFLLSLRSSRQGDCPPPQRATGFAAACVESCSSDQHCPAPKKCCSNGCGHTCQAPAHLYKGVPLKPRRDISFLEDPRGRVEVVWRSKFNVSAEPVVYLLQARWNQGIHPSEDHASPWHAVSMTLAERAVLSDLRPHRWYQFRVSASNSQGTRGFTTPSRHYISTQDPAPPDSPQRLRLTNETLGLGLEVRVLLLWDPASEGDLPVHHYRVTWSPRHTPEHTPGNTPEHTPGNTPGNTPEHTLEQTPGHIPVNTPENTLGHTPVHTPEHTPGKVLQGKKDGNTRLTQGAECKMELRGLLPGSAYLVSVQTVAYWGQKRLRSPRAHISFHTANTDTVPLRQVGSPQQEVSMEGEFSNELPSASRPLPLLLPDPAPHPDSNPDPGNLRLEAAAPHYHDNQLQVKVFWKRRNQEAPGEPSTYVLRWHPHACITNTTERSTTVQGTHYTITGLMFSCKYRVAVATEGDQRSEAVAWVTTPPCWLAKVRGVKAVPCTIKERPLAGRKAVLHPERLTASFQMVNGSLLCTFRWRLSQNAAGQPPVEGFQFTWTQLAPPPGVTMETEGPGTLVSQTQIVAPTERSLSVSGLQSESVYLLQVQVLTAGGSAASVSRTIRIPALSALS